VPRSKSEKVRLSVFKDREAKLNHAIIYSLEQKSPQTAWEIFTQFIKQKGMANLKYWTIIRRIESLHEQDYIMKVGETETMQGTETSLYQLTPRAELAIALTQTDLDNFVKKAGYDRILSALEAFQDLEQ